MTASKFLGCVGLNGDFIEWTWTLPSAATAFGADLDLTIPGFITDGLDLTVLFEAGGSHTFDIDAFLSPGTEGFFGFTSDMAFSTVRWTSPFGTTFTVDNLAVAVPLPSTFLLLASGLIGLGYFARKRAKR